MGAKAEGSRLLRNQEFQSALVRLGIWLFAATYIGLGWLTSHYTVDPNYYSWLFGPAAESRMIRPIT